MTTSFRKSRFRSGTVDPALKLGVTTTPPKVVINSNGEEKYSVGVTCNVEWTAKVGDSGEGWITIDEISDNEIKFSVPKYAGTVPRTGRIEFNATTERMTTVELSSTRAFRWISAKTPNSKPLPRYTRNWAACREPFVRTSRYRAP